MPGPDVSLLRDYPVGDVALLEAAAARLGVQVPEMPEFFRSARR